jgi:branched-chain amino acid transport system permease protein
MVITGFGLFELARRQYIKDRDDSQEYIEKEIKRREDL